MGDQQNFSLKYQNNIKQTSDENKEISIGGLLADPISNSPNSYDRSCVAESKENY